MQMSCILNFWPGVGKIGLVSLCRIFTYPLFFFYYQVCGVGLAS